MCVRMYDDDDTSQGLISKDSLVPSSFTQRFTIFGLAGAIRYWKKGSIFEGEEKKKKEKDSIESICSNFVYKKEKRKKRREIFRVNSNNCMEGIIIVEDKLNIVCVKKKKFSPCLSSIPPILSLNAINRLILKAKTSLLRVFFFLTFSLSLIHSLTRSVKILRARKIIPDWDWSSFIIHRCSKRTKKEEKRVYSLYIRRIENFLITYR